MVPVGSCICCPSCNLLHMLIGNQLCGNELPAIVLVIGQYQCIVLEC